MARTRQVYASLTDDEIALLDKVASQRSIAGVRISRPQIVGAFIRRGIAEHLAADAILTPDERTSNAEALLALLRAS